MIEKSLEKIKAVELRRRGLSYGEILEKIPVAKSTLSLWLKDVGLSTPQKQRLTQKRLDAIQRGGLARKNQRLNLIQDIKKGTSLDIKKLDKNSLWLAGIMLYWAEGTKEKPHNIGQQTQLTNSDPKMIKVFLKWLREIIGLKEGEISIEMYIHENGDVNRALNYWSKIIACDKSKIKIYFKRHHPKRTYRKNTGDGYFGLVRVRVRKSSILNRRISVWVELICNYWGIV